MRDGKIRNWAHICVDVQSLFAEPTEWHAPWLERVLPAIETLSEAAGRRTIFTRFIPPHNAHEAHGNWRGYYQRWPDMVRDKLPPDLLDLVPSLKRLAPPAKVLDKSVYSPWWSGDLHRSLQGAGIDTVAISGGETDICVLATVLGAVDLGYHVWLPLDALFGSADATHDAVLDIYRCRLQTQLTTTTTQDLIHQWQEDGL